MSMHIGAFPAITGKRIVESREETVASSDALPVHTLLLRFDDGSSLTIDLLSASALSYDDGKPAPATRRRRKKARKTVRKR